MKIKKLFLENFLCYYGRKEFVFEDGINLILGRNGEGKTKFFEAFEWLFSSSEKADINIVSAKRLKDIKENETFTVRVALTVEKFGENFLIEKCFEVSLKKSQINIENFRFIAYENKLDGSRIPIDGDKKLEIIFPAKIRRYSMFKGEAELNIFNNENALKELIDTFSEVKHYPPYINLSDKLYSWFQEAMDKTSRSNEKINREVNIIQAEIERRALERHKYDRLKKEAEQELEKASNSLSQIEKNSERCEMIKVLNDRIRKKTDEINSMKVCIDESYTTFLLDEKWILYDFQPYYESFCNKILEVRKSKNFEEKKHNKEIAKKEVKLELLNEATPLPWFIPDESTLKELLKDELCKVCNRPAPKGSEAYSFMESKLKEYIDRTNQKNKTENDYELLFPNNYIENFQKLQIELSTNGINIENLKNEIAERLEFNRCRKEDLKRLEEELDKEIEEKNRIMAESTVHEDELLSMHSNIREWTLIISESSRSIEDYRRKIESIDAELNEKNETKNRKLAQVLPGYQMETNRILKDINSVFTNTKERLLSEFIDLLEEKSNQFISRINVDDFTGRIRLRRSKDKISVLLINADETPIYKPHGSLEISMYMAVLFGISELAFETKEENYPMIFDAPTSSFDGAKVQDFYNLIYDLKKQCIIATKDFTIMKDDRTPCVDEDTIEKVKRDKTYWICRIRPFNKEDLSTIETIVEPYE
jgi:DNA sulfur modification protein DndD